MSDTLRIKAAFVETKQAETGKKTFTFRASTDAVDRQNEVIDQRGWVLDSYRANPVILDSHKYGSIEDIIGRATRVEMKQDGLEVDVEFADTPKGNQAEALVAQGFLNSVSVGFRSLERKPAGMGQPVTHTRSELLEISMVAIPANRDAMRIRQNEEGTELKILHALELFANALAAHERNGSRLKEESKGVEIEPGTLAALSRFAQEAN